MGNDLVQISTSQPTLTSESLAHHILPEPQVMPVSAGAPGSGKSQLFLGVMALLSLLVYS